MTSLVEICPAVLERTIFNFFNVLLFHSNLPLEKRMTLHLNKLKFFSPKNALCQVWLKLDQWFWRRRFFKDFVNVFSLFRYYIPFGKAWTIPLTKRCFLPSLIKISQVVLEHSFKFSLFFRYFVFRLSPLGKGGALL